MYTSLSARTKASFYHDFRSRDDQQATQLDNMPLKSRPPILRLPTELIDMIFDRLRYIEDRIVLCLVHTRFGDVGEPRVNRTLVRWKAPWARNHIVCIGNYAYDHDLSVYLKSLFEQWFPERAKDAMLTEDAEIKEDPGAYTKDRKSVV